MVFTKKKFIVSWCNQTLCKFLKTKIYSLASIKKKYICQKKLPKNLVQVWFASVFAPSSAAPGSPFVTVKFFEFCHDLSFVTF